MNTINHIQSSSPWLETCPWKPEGIQTCRKPKVWQIWFFNNREYVFHSRGLWKYLVSLTILFILKELQAGQFCWLQHQWDWPIWYRLEALLLYEPCTLSNSFPKVHADSWGTVCSCTWVHTEEVSFLLLDVLLDGHRQASLKGFFNSWICSYYTQWSQVDIANVFCCKVKWQSPVAHDGCKIQSSFTRKKPVLMPF